MTEIKEILSHIMTLKQRTFEEIHRSELYLDLMDEDYPTNDDELATVLRSAVFGKHKELHGNYHIISTDDLYDYWCCGSWRKAFEIIEHTRDRHSSTRTLHAMKMINDIGKIVSVPKMRNRKLPHDQY